MDNASRQLPDNPLAFIRRCVNNRDMRWTHHANMRLGVKRIARGAVVDSIDNYEIIESNPDDKYLPSYLVYTEYDGEHFHILFATDVAGGNVRVVTVYRPSDIKWMPDYKTRRRQQ